MSRKAAWIPGSGGGGRRGRTAHEGDSRTQGLEHSKKIAGGWSGVTQRSAGRRI